MAISGQSEGRRRIDFDGRNDRRDKFKEDDEVEVDPHALYIVFFVRGRRRYLLVLVVTGPSKQPLLLAFFGCWRARQLSLLLDNAGVHALNDFFHYAGMFAGVHGGCLEGRGVREGFNGDGFESMICRDVLEDLRRGQWRSILR